MIISNGDPLQIPASCCELHSFRHCLLRSRLLKYPPTCHVLADTVEPFADNGLIIRIYSGGRPDSEPKLILVDLDLVRKKRKQLQLHQIDVETKMTEIRALLPVSG